MLNKPRFIHSIPWLCLGALLWGLPARSFPQTPPDAGGGAATATEAAETAGLPEETGEDLPVYALPEADVRADRESPDLITPEELERYNAHDLWEAVRHVPGVLLSGGGRRNDSNFTVRGFGSDSVPIFVDGIVLANTYRGEGDAARYLTGDLESVEIQKGYSSPLLGANTLGGAVLLQTAKPREPLELSLKTGVDFDDVGAFNGAVHVLSAGGRGEGFYGKTVFQYRGIDHYRLSADFEPTRGNPQEEGNRLWSDSTDMKLTLLGGLTPLRGNEFLDIWFTYLYQDSDKGISPPDVNIRDIYIWDWPLWKRQSLSLNGVFEGGPFSLKTVAYFDKYDNRLDEYFNWAAFEHGVHNAHSDYDEYSTGGRLEGTWDINSWNRFAAALIFKREDHIGLHGDVEDVQINEDTWSFGTEYTVNPPGFSRVRISGGLGFDLLIPQTFDGVTNRLMQELGESWYVVKSRKMLLLNAQGGIYYDFNGDHQVRFTYARKNRFPTMFQRYSTRMGRVLPNSLLGPETAHHFELGYRGTFRDTLMVNAALYYSRLKGKIVTVPVPNPKVPYLAVDFSRNLDETSLYGLELNGELYLGEYMSAGASFSLGGYDINHSEAQVVSLPYYPEKSGNLYVELRPAPLLALLSRLEYLDDRYVDAVGGETLSSYWLVHLKLTVHWSSHLTLSAGIENLLDTYYEIRQNAPLAGRTYTLSCTLQY
jgi:iron complex outermembrane receptor protein